MTDGLTTPVISLRHKPIQMALLSLGYDHQMIVNGDDVQLRLDLPGVDVIFRIDPVTLCVEAVLTWTGGIPREEAGDALHYLVQINRTVFEPQFALVDTGGDALVMQGRVFLFAGAGVTWEQTAEFVHYCLTEVTEVFLDTCAQVWPEAAPAIEAVKPPEPTEVEFEFSGDDSAPGNPFGLISGPTPEVTLERIHGVLAHLGADNLHLVEGQFVEYTFMGQRVSLSLTSGRDGRDRQTLVISSGSGLVVETQEQLDQIFYLCNDATGGHVMVTVFAEEIENGARWGIFAESRFDLPAGLSEEQLGTVVLNTSKWNSELCLTLRMKAAA